MTAVEYQVLDQKEGEYESYRVGDNFISLTRRVDIPRERLLTTDKFLSEGGWIAVALIEREEGEVLEERYIRLPEHNTEMDGESNFA